MKMDINETDDKSPCVTACQIDFRERGAIFDHTVRGALSPPHTSRAPGFGTKDQASARDSNAAQGNTSLIAFAKVASMSWVYMEATLANLLRKECQGCSKARRPSRPASRIQFSGAIVASQPWFQLTGGYARCLSANSMAGLSQSLRKIDSVGRGSLVVGRCCNPGTVLP